MNKVRIGLAIATAVALLAGCRAAPRQSEPQASQATSVPSSERSITVFAASSLTGLFTELASRYEATHSGLHITLSFGSSSTLAQQIVEGAPANVFAAASTKAMGAAGSRIVDARDYVSNTVVVAEPAAAGTTGGVMVDGGGAAELDRVGRWIQCAHEAPCGAAADAAVARFGVRSTPASLEPDAKSVIAKLLAGEADAGIVYLTDAIAGGDKLNITAFGTFAPGSAEQAALTTRYQVAQVDAGNADAAGFVDFVLGTESLLSAQRLGFGPPPA